MIDWAFVIESILALWIAGFTSGFIMSLVYKLYKGAF